MFEALSEQGLKDPFMCCDIIIFQCLKLKSLTYVLLYSEKWECTKIVSLLKLQKHPQKYESFF